MNSFNNDFYFIINIQHVQHYYPQKLELVNNIQAHTRHTISNIKSKTKTIRKNERAKYLKKTQ